MKEKNELEDIEKSGIKNTNENDDLLDEEPKAILEAIRTQKGKDLEKPGDDEEEDDNEDDDDEEDEDNKDDKKNDKDERDNDEDDD